MPGLSSQTEKKDILLVQKLYAILDIGRIIEARHHPKKAKVNYWPSYGIILILNLVIIRLTINA